QEKVKRKKKRVGRFSLVLLYFFLLPFSMTGLYERIEEARQAIASRWPGRPRAGIILGTGLGGLAQDIETEAALAYEDVPHFPRSTVASHTGRLVCGRLAGKTVVAMEGRFHFYEGY